MTITDDQALVIQGEMFDEDLRRPDFVEKYGGKIIFYSSREVLAVGENPDEAYHNFQSSPNFGRGLVFLVRDVPRDKFVGERIT